MRSMKLATGTVVDGRVVLDGSSLPEGTVVTVVAPQGSEAFDLPQELEAALEESLAQVARGETVPAAEVIRRLRVY